ncbi:hypothetical protein NMY22_g10880 [Coprinellus aureogranulatus]|nr:hypothetical protein NMY22_g10880 [Coprinellus aureogranulatus]
MLGLVGPAWGRGGLTSSWRNEKTTVFKADETAESRPWPTASRLDKFASTSFSLRIPTIDLPTASLSSQAIAILSRAWTSRTWTMTDELPGSDSNTVLGCCISRETRWNAIPLAGRMVDGIFIIFDDALHRPDVEDRPYSLLCSLNDGAPQGLWTWFPTLTNTCPSWTRMKKNELTKFSRFFVALVSGVQAHRPASDDSLPGPGVFKPLGTSWFRTLVLHHPLTAFALRLHSCVAQLVVPEEDEVTAMRRYCGARLRYGVEVGLREYSILISEPGDTALASTGTPTLMTPKNAFGVSCDWTFEPIGGGVIGYGPSFGTCSIRLTRYPPPPSSASSASSSTSFLALLEGGCILKSPLNPTGAVSPQKQLYTSSAGRSERQLALRRETLPRR